MAIPKYLKLKAHHYDANRHGIIRLSSAAAEAAAVAKWATAAATAPAVVEAAVAAAVTSGTKCIFNINTS